MSGDLRLGGIAGAAGAGSETQESAAASQRAAFPAAPAANAAAAAAAGPALASRIAELPNPRLHTDLALNRLVLEFFNAQGNLTNSIPSQKQLDAYRLAAFSGKAVRS